MERLDEVQDALLLVAQIGLVGLDALQGVRRGGFHG
jgi:hypothetical protein